MAQLLVRDIDENVRQWLRERGARHGRSMEAEAREVLRRARRIDEDDPIGKVLNAMRGRYAEPTEVPDQLEHEPATFQ